MQTAGSDSAHITVVVSVLLPSHYPRAELYRYCMQDNAAHLLSRP